MLKNRKSFQNEEERIKRFEPLMKLLIAVGCGFIIGLVLTSIL